MKTKRHTCTSIFIKCFIQNPTSLVLLSANLLWLLNFGWLLGSNNAGDTSKSSLNQIWSVFSNNVLDGFSRLTSVSLQDS